MDRAAFEAHLKQIVEPLSPDAPCGTNLKRDDDFVRVRDEVKGKLGTPQAGEIDWAMAASVGNGILTERSKDVVLATYTALALFRTERYEGLAKGLGTIRVLAEKWWDGCFPPARRMRARTGALDWFFDRLESEVKDELAQASEYEALQACIDEIKAMNGHFRAALGGDAPSTRRPRDAMELRLGELPPPAPPEPEPEPEPAPEPVAEASAPPVQSEAPRTQAQEPSSPSPAAPPAPSAQPVAPPPAAPAPKVNVPPPPSASGPPAEVLKDLRRTFSGLGQAAVALRTGTPLDPLPYRLSRIAAWTLLKAAPNNKDGKTVIPDPNKAELQHFDGLIAAESWEELVQKAETRFISGPLWLDLQYYVAKGLKGMGAPAKAARQTVITYVADLVERIPDLMSLSFKGGTPFASGATMRWIDAEVRNAGSAPAMAAPSGGGGALNPAMEQLAAMVGAAETIDGLNAAQSQVNSLATPADRFRGQLLVAGACLRLDHAAHASALLEDLYETAQQHHLSSWDPPAQADLLELMVQARLKTSAEGAEDGRTMASLIAELCSVDIGRALRYRYPA